MAAAITNILKIDPLQDDRCLHNSSPDGRCINRIPEGDRQAAGVILGEVSRRVARGTANAGRATERPLKRLARLLFCNQHLSRFAVEDVVIRWLQRLLAWECRGGRQWAFDISSSSPSRPSVTAHSSSPAPSSSTPDFEAVFLLDLSGFEEPSSSTDSSNRDSSTYTIHARYTATDTQDDITTSTPGSPITYSHSASDSQDSTTTFSHSNSYSSRRTTMPEAISPPPLPSSDTIVSPITASPALSSSTTSTQAPATVRVPPTVTKSRYSVTRRQIEGDCGICILPFSVDPNNPYPGVDADGDVAMHGECDVEEESHYEYDESDGEPEDEECDDDDEDEDDEDDDEDDEDDEDDSEGDYDDYGYGTGENTNSIVWCKVRCGTNYHRSCLNNWIDTFKTETYRRPTCPTCRATWKD